MKAVLTAIIMILVGSASAEDEVQLFLIVAKDTPVATVVSNYARHSGIPVVIASGVTGVVNIAQDGPITRTEYLRRTATGLENISVGLYPNGTNGLIAQWIYPKPPPPPAPPHRIKPFVSSESPEAQAARDKALLKMLRAGPFKTDHSGTETNVQPRTRRSANKTSETR
jgi:type II secretory pathway component GspD/PulD (secretin)